MQEQEVQQVQEVQIDRKLRANVTPMISSSRPYLIVVGIDYSEVSRLALRRAFSAAATHSRSELRVLHVETELHSYTHDGASTPAPQEEVLTRSLQRVETFVAREFEVFQRGQLERKDERPVMGVFAHAHVAAPGAEIAKFATDVSADLIVVGTHGRSGLARLLLGSVAHTVVTLAPCPVLVVRAKQLTEATPLQALDHRGHELDLPIVCVRK